MDEINESGQSAGEMVPRPAALSLPQTIAEAGAMPLETWCSFVPRTPHEQMALYDALNGSDVSFGDSVGKTISLVNVAMQSKDVTDEQTGETRRVVVTSLFAADGAVYSGASVYVARSVRNMMMSGWIPPFTPPLPVEIVRIKTNRGHMLRLRIVATDVDVSDHVTEGEPLPRKQRK